MKLPSMHTILDVVEDMLREGCKDENEWTKLSMQLYAPEKGERNLDGWRSEDQLAAFNAFMGAV